MNGSVPHGGGPAFPITEQTCTGLYQGLSKRDYIAAIVLQGLWAGADYWDTTRDDDFTVVLPRLAVKQADALLRELGY